jgi:hypothetical protein
MTARGRHARSGDGLFFPEGPVVMPGGSIVVVEIV